MRDTEMVVGGQLIKYNRNKEFRLCNCCSRGDTNERKKNTTNTWISRFYCHGR